MDGSVFVEAEAAAMDWSTEVSGDAGAQVVEGETRKFSKSERLSGFGVADTFKDIASGFGVADAFKDVARPSSTGGAVEDVSFAGVDGTATEYEGKNLWFMTRRRLQLIAKRLNSGNVKLYQFHGNL